MKVKQAIKLLEIYDSEDELMIDWVDKYQASVDDDEQWKVAVAMMESSNEGMIDMHYVQDIVDDAIINTTLLQKEV